MSRQAHIALPLLMLVLLMGVASCNDDSCYENGSSLPLAEFYMNGAKSTITGITVMGIGVPGDSLLADSGSLNEIYLPLRASTSSTSYFIGRWVTFEGERLECRMRRDVQLRGQTPELDRKRHRLGDTGHAHDHQRDHSRHAHTFPRL